MSVSVVIPAYNASRYLRETIESVLRQTLQADEVLVIDDGSTDDTADVAETFGVPVRVLRRPNQRQGAARNFGVQEAKSEWIAFLDSDDVWEPEKLERQMQELAKHPEADLCYTARRELIQEGDSARLAAVVPVVPAADIGTALLRNTHFLPSVVVVRRSVFLAAGGFATHFKIVEDWDLWLRLRNAGVKFAACPEALVRYRVHPQSVSRNGMVLKQERDEIYQRLVLPYLPAAGRRLRCNRQMSEHEACAAFDLRKEGDARALGMMARSVARSPLYWPHRYKVLAHCARSNPPAMRSM